jgi:colanic acid/amylovoran biosynthesis glycosyltransferase
LILLLFTATYPYDASEQTFLDVEVRHLLDEFEQVVLVPRNLRGRRLPLPNGIEVEESYSVYLNETSSRIVGGLATLRSSYFYQEIFARPHLLLFPRALIRLIGFFWGAHLTARWLENWIEGHGQNTSQLMFYTYWLDQATMGIGLVKQRDARIRLVSRAHGYDIYEEYYYKPAFWPGRHVTLSLLDRLFPDSEAGARYLKERYPGFVSKYQTELLGVVDPGFVNGPSQDGVLRIVSCSMIRPEKRVDQILEGVHQAAKLRPSQRFEWYHIGNGDTRVELQKRANETLPPNAQARLPGYSGKQALMRFYQDTSLDVFVNLSATEGTPVSIMEAISCGIPVIATNVGGNPEIVSERNGILLSPNPTSDKVAQALLKICDNPEMAKKMRSESRRVWEESYNADVNFRAFARQLKAIRQG